MKKRTSFFTISSILIVLILCFLIRVLWITRTNSSLRARDLDFKLNFEKYWAYGNANVITLSTLTVGKWSTMYLNNQYGPVFKVNSTHVLMVRGSGNDQVLYYLKINDDDKLPLICLSVLYTLTTFPSQIKLLNIISSKYLENVINCSTEI